MLRFPERFVLSGAACALLAVWGLAAGSSDAQAGSMHNCPPAGKWSIAVWAGDSGTAAADALATCGDGAVAAAYSLDPTTGAWFRWFAGKPDVSNLAQLGEMQGVLALGGAAAAAGADALTVAQAEGEMHNCPPAAKWSIAVWEGASGTAASDALAACGADAVVAAYSLDPQTGGWLRWFAGKPDLSNLPPLNDMQGVLALGAAGGPATTPTPAATATPKPTATATPKPPATATATEEPTQEPEPTETATPEPTPTPSPTPISLTFSGTCSDQFWHDVLTEPPFSLADGLVTIHLQFQRVNDSPLVGFGGEDFYRNIQLPEGQYISVDVEYVVPAGDHYQFEFACGGTADIGGAWSIQVQQ